MYRFIKTLMLTCLSVILLSTPVSASATPAEPITAKDIQEFDALYQSTINKPGAEIDQEQPYLTRVTVTSEHAVYFFAQKGHPAYPSVVIRKAVQKGNVVYAETTGDSWGDQDVFKSWLQQFTASDSDLKNQLR